MREVDPGAILLMKGDPHTESASEVGCRFYSSHTRTATEEGHYDDYVVTTVTSMSRTMK